LDEIDRIGGMKEKKGQVVEETEHREIEDGQHLSLSIP